MEFFQIFRLHNAKIKLREYFNVDPALKGEYKKYVPNFIAFLDSDREVPEEFLLPKNMATRAVGSTI